MQGDPKVDELMRPVLAAIKRHLKDSDAKTDIYNRAYEALMISMEVNKSRAEKAEAELAALREQTRWIRGGDGSHWEGCEETHWDCKIAQLEAEIERQTAELAALRERTRWIPVSEKLPLPAQKRDGYMSDSSELVHVYPPPKNDRAVCYLHYLEKWSCSAEVTPTHWRPIDLPEVKE